MKVWVKFIFNLDNKKIFFISLVLGLVFTINFCVWGSSYSFSAQNGIADEIVRFHVLANSDTNFDQALKLKVRDEVLKGIAHNLSVAKNKLQTKALISADLDKINDIACKIVVQNGFDYDVKVMMSNDYFPTKKYGDIKFPAGRYDTLKIVIGNGEGHNWWCVMFPPLCFVDAAKKSVPENLKTEMKNILTDDEFQLINSENEKAPAIKVKFKIVEAWQKFSMKNKFVRKIVKDVA